MKHQVELQEFFFRFNRTKVELKYLKNITETKQSFRFNRTKVELKFILCFFNTKLSQSFNRTKVELKYKWSVRKYASASQVLIALK